MLMWRLTGDLPSRGGSCDGPEGGSPGERPGGGVTGAAGGSSTRRSRVSDPRVGESDCAAESDVSSWHVGAITRGGAVSRADGDSVTPTITRSGVDVAVSWRAAGRVTTDGEAATLGVRVGAATTAGLAGEGAAETEAEDVTGLIPDPKI